jgi:UDP-2,4-diacetamido-2,4,6-trideoxy-beta-L-altropyranose hydrolase
MNDSHLRLLIRADAGPQIGTGHVMRMIALGQAWKRLHGDVAFACGDLPGGLIRRITSEGFKLFQLGNARCDSQDASDTRDVAAAFEPHWICLDGYRFDDAYQKRIAKNLPQSSGLRHRLLVVDDYQHATHQHADFVVNQNAYADDKFYGNIEQSDSKAGPEYLTGSRFTLLRSEFSNTQFEPKRIMKQARRILITFGGADPDNWTLRTLQSLENLDRQRLVVDCVVGACYRHTTELSQFKRQANMNLRVHRNIDRMSSLMQQVDLAITAGGSTCYELARCGVPALVVSIAENQTLNTAAMDQSGAMLSVFRPTDDVASSASEDEKIAQAAADTQLQKTIKKLLNDPVKRQNMSDAGVRLVDGQGATRLATQMTGLCFAFRKAVRDDADLTLAWRRDPESRAASFTDKPISASDHKTWIQPQNNQRPGKGESTVWIAQDASGIPVGLIRFQINPQRTATVEILVAPSRRGAGLGTILLSRASHLAFQELSVDRIVASINPINLAGEKAFKNVGFQPILPTTVNGQLANQFELLRSEFLGETSESEPRSELRKSA